MGKQDIALQGGTEGVCSRGHFQAQAQSNSSCRGGSLLPVGPVHLVWPPVLLARTCFHPPRGRGGGRVQRVGLTGVLIRLGRNCWVGGGRAKGLRSACPGARTEAGLGADVRGSWGYSGARESQQEGPARRGILSWFPL